jgi:hypothetical protein
MIEGDEILLRCNESELLWMARLQGLPILRRDLPRDELISIVSGALSPGVTHISNTNYTRDRLEQFVNRHMARLYSQLPGCDGKCRSFKCSEGKHVACLIPSEPYLE